MAGPPNYHDDKVDSGGRGTVLDPDLDVGDDDGLAEEEAEVDDIVVGRAQPECPRPFRVQDLSDDDRLRVGWLNGFSFITSTWGMSPSTTRSRRAGSEEERQMNI